MTPDCDTDVFGSRELTVGPGETATVDLDLTLGITSITGYARYRDGEPAPNVRIGARAASDCLYLKTRSDEEGAWSMEVPTDMGAITVLRPNSNEVIAEAIVAPGTTGIELVVERVVEQRLRVLDGATGLPVTDFELYWQRPGADQHRAIRSAAGLPDPEGWYEVRMHEGPFDLAVSTFEHDPDARPAFAFDQHTGNRQPLEFTIRRGKTIELKLKHGEEPWPKDTDIYLLAEHERGALRRMGEGRVPLPGDLSTGHNVHKSRRVRFSGRRAKLTGLPPGKYEFIAFPDDVVVEPASIVAGGGEKKIRWRRR